MIPSVASDVASGDGSSPACEVLSCFPNLLRFASSGRPASLTLLRPASTLHVAPFRRGELLPEDAVDIGTMTGADGVDDDATVGEDVCDELAACGDGWVCATEGGSMGGRDGGGSAGEGSARHDGGADVEGIDVWVISRLGPKAACAPPADEREAEEELS